MTDRDRLIHIIMSLNKPTISLQTAMDITDAMIENGVCVPAVNVGRTVYVPNGDEEGDWVDEYKVKYFYCSSKGINRYYVECGTMGNNFRPKDIDKTVFLTKEEAERSLKEQRKEDEGK